MTDTRPDQRSTVSGMLNLSRNLGLITGASIMGAVFVFAFASATLSRSPDAVESSGPCRQQEYRCNLDFSRFNRLHDTHTPAILLCSSKASSFLPLRRASSTIPEPGGCHDAGMPFFDSCDVSATLAAMSANSAQVTSIKHRFIQVKIEQLQVMPRFSSVNPHLGRCGHRNDCEERILDRTDRS